jgi:branched-chain amino acid transport system ATP-binding protein
MSVAAVADVAASQPAYFSASGLNAYYGDSYIVQDVSFEVKEGEIVALLGRNGAGKTSTLRAIARAESPELRSGQIWLGRPGRARDAVVPGVQCRHSAGA